MVILQIGKYTITSGREVVFEQKKDGGYSTDFHVADTSQNRIALGVTGVAQIYNGGLWRPTSRACIITTDNFISRGIIWCDEITNEGLRCFVTSLSVQTLNETIQKALEYHMYITNDNLVPLYKYTPSDIHDPWYDGFRVNVGPHEESEAVPSPLPNFTYNDIDNLFKTLGYTVTVPNYVRSVFSFKPNSLWLWGGNKYRKISIKARHIAHDGGYAGISQSVVSHYESFKANTGNIRQMGMMTIIDAFVVDNDTRAIYINLSLDFNSESTDIATPLTFGATISDVGAEYKLLSSSGEVLTSSNQEVGSIVDVGRTLTENAIGQEVLKTFVITSLNGGVIPAGSRVTVTFQIAPNEQSMPNDHDLMANIQYYFDDDYFGFKQVINWSDCVDQNYVDSSSDSAWRYRYTSHTREGFNTSCLGYSGSGYDVVNDCSYNSSFNWQAVINLQTGRATAYRTHHPALQYIYPLSCCNCTISQLIWALAAAISQTERKPIYANINTADKTISFDAELKADTDKYNRLPTRVEISNKYTHPFYGDAVGVDRYYGDNPPNRDIKVDEKQNLITTIGTCNIRPVKNVYDYDRISYDDVYICFCRNEFTHFLASNSEWWDDYHRINFLIGDSKTVRRADWEITNEDGLIIAATQLGYCIGFYKDGKGVGIAIANKSHLNNWMLVLPPFTHQLITFDLPKPIPTTIATIKSNTYFIEQQEICDGNTEVTGILLMKKNEG